MAERGCEGKRAGGDGASREDVFHHAPMHVGEPELAALETVGEARVVGAEAVEDGRLQVVNMHRLLDDVEAEVIRCADFIPSLEVISLTSTETLRAMREAQPRGVRGGAIFDYLLLVAARKARAKRLYTLNVANFRSFHRPGDPDVLHP